MKKDSQTEEKESDAKASLRRFENKAQLIRHISEETGTDIDTLWEEYEAQIE